MRVQGEGPLVLFLHGIGGNSLNWLSQLDAFAGRYKAAAWDARGYGESGGSVEAFEQFADDAAKVIEALGRPAHVVGLSMGGRIALDLVKRYPQSVRTLTLANTSAGSRETASPEKVEAFLALRLKPLVEDGLSPADIAERIVDGIAGPNISPAAREALLDSHRRLHTQGYVAAMRAVTGFSDFPEFAEIKVPTLVLTATEDSVAPPAHARLMAGQIAGARLVEIEGAGHISNLEAPEAFDRALGAFLAEHA
ncbi:MAG: alpha/beta fold hydrolase [Erythrobacter sp.]|nr:alpha/beta fold hydrolase [Erythrobacter sp.]